MRYLLLGFLALVLALLVFQPPGIMAQVYDNDSVYCAAPSPVTLSTIQVDVLPVSYTSRSLPGPTFLAAVPEVADLRCTSLTEPVGNHLRTYNLLI